VYASTRSIGRLDVRGRKPKPTWLKLVAGNPGRRPLNRSEPLPEGALVDDPPDWLTPSQKDIWRAAIENAPPGLLRRIDESVFLVWVIAKDLHRTASERIAQTGTLIRMPHSPMALQSPWVLVMNKQAAIMIKAAVELGFTPSSRSRISIEPVRPFRNKFELINKMGQLSNE
jgi:P27 family predicted phage terminase small subunit